jgi:predicted nucleic acid-binding protein
LADNNLEKAIEIIEKYHIDLFDALQIVDVKYGQYSSFRRKSQTLLITADENLANAAKKEGVRV